MAALTNTSYNVYYVKYKKGQISPKLPEYQCFLGFTSLLTQIHHYLSKLLQGCLQVINDFLCQDIRVGEII
jgi:hypothetical protein